MAGGSTASSGPRPDLVELWNRAVARHFPMRIELLELVTTDDPSFQEADLLEETLDGKVVGFAVAKRFRGQLLEAGDLAQVGFVPLLAVHPAHQRQGIGRRLLARAEEQLAAQGAHRVVLGGSFFHAMPGIPTALPGARAFFEQQGYVAGKTVWDLARDLRSFEVPPALRRAVANGAFEPVLVQAERAMSYEPPRTAALLEFLAAEFPGRWLYDVAQAFGNVLGRAGAMAIFEGDRVVAFAQVHEPGSFGTRRWRGFDPHVAAIGPVGVAKAYRGRELGAAVVALAAETLRQRGAARVVIDWTDLVTFYGKLGFEPWLSYVMAAKSLPLKSV